MKNKKTAITASAFILVIPFICCAQETAQTEGTSLGEVFLDNVFLITLLFVFISALVTALLALRARDRCLKDFHEFPVLLELEKEHKIIWGDLDLYSNGMVLIYHEPHMDIQGHQETSFIIYKDEWSDVMALYRSADELEADLLEKRSKAIRKTYQPSVFRRSWRKIKNFLNILRDAVVNSIGILVGQARKAVPSSTVLKTQDRTITEMGKTFIQSSAGAYDSILESLIGKNVVVEMEREGKVVEYPGILKEYSVNFLEFLSVKEPMDVILPVRKDGRPAIFHGLEIYLENNILSLTNKGSADVKIVSVSSGEEVEPHNKLIEPGTSSEIPIKEGPLPEKLFVRIRLSADIDLILPRSRAKVRHAGKIEALNWKAFFGLK